MSKTTVIDAHAHLGICPQFYFPVYRWQDVLKHMDATGVDILIQANQSMLGVDLESAEQENREAFEGSRGRIYAYAVYNPNNHDAATMVPRLLAERHYVGIKIHPSFHGIHADNELYRPAWTLAQEHKVPILTHSYDRTARNPNQALSWVMYFEKWIKAFPDVTLILGHSGGLPQGHREAVGLAKKYPNVYLDLAGDTFANGFVEWVVKEIGADRLLYGSDLTWIDTRAELYRVIAADIDTAAKRRILGENAIRLFPRMDRGITA